jgi:hypothetical protein
MGVGGLEKGKGKVMLTLVYAMKALAELGYASTHS